MTGSSVSGDSVSGEAHSVGRAYLICATPRTGSYLLCDALRSTGLAGNPTEYFSYSYEKHWSQVWGAKDLDSYLRHVLDSTTTPNGIFEVDSHQRHFYNSVSKVAGRA